MWYCPQCHEASDDAFDTCWKCGAAADGTPDPNFTAEPDDPSVPDPGAAAIEVSRQPQQPPADMPAEQMSRHALATLICQTVALVLFALAAILSSAGILMLLAVIGSAANNRSDDSYDFFPLLIASAPLFATLFIAIVFWSKSKSIASLMVPQDSKLSGVQPFTTQDVKIVAFSTVGLVFFLLGVRELAELVYVAHRYSLTSSSFWYEINIWFTVIQLLVSVWLILGSRGIVGAIKRFQAAGLPEEENATDQAK